LRGKPVAVIGASPSPSGAARAQAEAATVLRASGANALERQLPVAHADERFDNSGRLTSEEHRRQLAELVAELVTCSQESHRLAAAA
jgi:chromate reductase